MVHPYLLCQGQLVASRKTPHAVAAGVLQTLANFDVVSTPHPAAAASRSPSPCAPAPLCVQPQFVLRVREWTGSKQQLQEVRASPDFVAEESQLQGAEPRHCAARPPPAPTLRGQLRGRSCWRWGGGDRRRWTRRMRGAGAARRGPPRPPLSPPAYPASRVKNSQAVSVLERLGLLQEAVEDACSKEFGTSVQLIAPAYLDAMRRSETRE